MRTIKKEEKATIKEKFLELMDTEEVLGNVLMATRRLKDAGHEVGRRTLYYWRNEDKNFADKWEEVSHNANEQFADEAEASLRKLVLTGNPTAIIFSLKNLRRKQWNDMVRVEGTGKDGAVIVEQHKASPELINWIKSLIPFKKDEK